MPTFDDNSLVSQYIRTLENPDSLGYKNGKWYASPYDPNARGFGVDVVKNEEAQKVANGRIGGWLSEEEERNLRNAYINTSSSILDKHYYPYLRKDTLSDSKRMMGIGLLYRGDGINADKELSDAYYNGTDNDFQKAVEQYYKKKTLPERARLHSTFMNSHKPKFTSKQILPTNKWEDMEYKPPLKFSEGGQMETVKLWEELSIPEKAAMMRVAVKNGITNLQDIKREYNEFAKGGPKKKPSVNGNAQRAMDYFMNKGLSQHQAAGLVGNLMRESGMSPTAVNSSSGAYGLAQWLGSRKKALFNKYGNNPTLNQQLDFVWNELNSTHKKGLKALKSSKSAEEAARNAMGYYEFMAGPDAAVREMRKYGQDGEGSMRKGINYASILMGHSPSKSPIVPTTPISPINPSISQESLEFPIPFTPFNPEAFFATPDIYQQSIVVEEPEAQEPVAISPYSPEEIERQERMNRLSAFNRILSLTNPYPQEEDSFLSTIGLLTGNTFSKGGGIHIKPENRGKFTALKKRTGHSASWFKAHGTPAQKKMATFALNARKWNHK